MGRPSTSNSRTPNSRTSSGKGRGGRRGIRRWLPSWKLLTGLVALGIAFGVGLFVVGYAQAEIPDPNELAEAQTTVVYYADGESELGRFSAQDRVPLELEEIPEHVRQAVLAAEDRTFYENSGVSPRGIARAFWNNLRGGSQQGGSTITQQYVKNYYLQQDRTYTRKIREAFISIKLDREMGKDEILTDYLNTIYFGRGAYGVETAARNYYGKSASELTVAEGAVLAGVIPAPGAFDPAVDREAAERRFAYALDGMVEEGWLAAGEREALAFPEPIVYEREDAYGGPEGYLLTTAREEILARTELTDADLDRGGLRIVTTFDRQAQEAAAAAVQQLPEDQPKQLRVALAAINPADGAVVAMYGGADYVERNVNAATQDTAQAGSTFKPFTLVAALEDGVSLETEFDGDSQQEFEGFDRPVRNFGDGDGTDHGRVDLVEATASSVNTVYVALNEQVGPQRTVETAVAAGLPQDTLSMEPFVGNVLGAASPHPIDMAQAYATFAAQGMRSDRFTVVSVTYPDGTVAYEAQPESERVFDEDVMADTTFALQAVVQDGSGGTAQELGRPVAGKTGTSTDNRSAWFVGYTPQLAAAVALYTEDFSEIEPFGGARSITGGGFPATVWTAFMTAALEGTDVQEFPEPVFVGETPEPTTTTPATRTAPPEPPTTSEPEPEPTTTTTTTTPEPTETTTEPEPEPEPTETTTEPEPEPEPTETTTEPDPEPTETQTPPVPTPTLPVEPPGDDDDPPGDDDQGGGNPGRDG